MRSVQILTSLKKNHDIEEKTSKEDTIKKLRELYPQPSPLLLEKQKSSIANLYNELRLLLNLLEKEPLSSTLLTNKVAHLGFAKNLVEEGDSIPPCLLGFLNDLGKIFQQQEVNQPKVLKL